MKLVPALALLAALCLLTALPCSALAQCSSGAVNNDAIGGIRPFGTLFDEPVEVEYGESFLTDCDAHLISCEVSLVLPGYVNMGHLPVAVGDTVLCTIYDGNQLPIMRESMTLPTGESDRVLVFDFSAREFRLAAGQYFFLLSIPQDRWCYLNLGSEYTGGEAQQYMLDTWTAQSGDTMFNLQWDPASTYVATEETSWGAMKALYR